MASLDECSGGEPTSATHLPRRSPPLSGRVTSGNPERLRGLQPSQRRPGKTCPLHTPALLRCSRPPTASDTCDAPLPSSLVRPDPHLAFAGFRFPAEVITLAVRWYLRFGSSYRDVEELLAERGVEVDHVSIYRWVQRFTPVFETPLVRPDTPSGTAGASTRPTSRWRAPGVPLPGHRPVRPGRGRVPVAEAGRPSGTELLLPSDCKHPDQACGGGHRTRPGLSGSP